MLQGFEGRTKNLFRHVLNCSRLWTSESDPLWVPVPWNLRHRAFRGADVEGLVRAGLILHKSHDRARRRCAEFQPHPDVLREYEWEVLDNLDGTWVNLFDGKRTRRQPKHERKDETGNAQPELMRSAWDHVKPCPFDRAAGQRMIGLRRSERSLALMLAVGKLSEVVGYEEPEHLSVEERVELLKEKWEAAKAAGHPGVERVLQAKREYVTASGRFSNDLCCFERVAYRYGVKHEGGDVWASQETYRGSSTGRSSAHAGAFQNMSREMKRATIMGAKAKGYDVRNYDLDSSHDRILLEFFGDAGVRCEWLEATLEESGWKRRLASDIGVERETVKRCLHAMKMGAPVVASPVCEVYKLVSRDAGADAADAFERLRDATEPLQEALGEWHRHLTKEWEAENAYRGYAGRRYVRNDVMMTFCLDDYPDWKTRARKLAAFLLQGREAEFIYTLTKLSGKLGFTVVSLQHDGFVTLGEVPAAAIDEAKRLTGMDYAELVPKPFV